MAKEYNHRIIQFDNSYGCKKNNSSFRFCNAARGLANLWEQLLKLEKNELIFSGNQFKRDIKLYQNNSFQLQFFLYASMQSEKKQVCVKQLKKTIEVLFLNSNHNNLLIDVQLRVRIKPKDIINSSSRKSNQETSSNIHNYINKYILIVSSMKLERIITTIFVMLVIYDIFRVKPKLEQPQAQETFNQTEQNQEEKTEIQEPIQENFSEDAEYIESSLPIIVEIFYCNRTGLHTQYQELERNIYLTFPKNKNLQIYPAEYPVPEFQAKLSQILNYGQYALMGVMFFYKQLFSLLGMPVPPIVEKIVEKKMFVLIGAILLNQYGQNALLATGKMKIYIDSKIIFDESAPIQTEKVLQLIKTELLKLQ